MTSRAIAFACLLVVVTVGAGPAHARTIGQIIDDTVFCGDISSM